MAEGYATITNISAPEYALEGESITINITVRNDGVSDILKVYLLDVAGVPIWIGSDKSVVSGSSETWTFNILMPNKTFDFEVRGAHHLDLPIIQYSVDDRKYGTITLEVPTPLLEGKATITYNAFKDVNGTEITESQAGQEIRIVAHVKNDGYEDYIRLEIIDITTGNILIDKNGLECYFEWTPQVAGGMGGKAFYIIMPNKNLNIQAIGYHLE